MAAVLSLLSFGTLWLEYGLLNFGDSDLPPYRLDTLSQKAVWFAFTIGAGLGWLFTVAYVIAMLFRGFRRRMA